MNNDLGRWEGRRRDSLPCGQSKASLPYGQLKALSRNQRRPISSDVVVRSRQNRSPTCSKTTFLPREESHYHIARYDERFSEHDTYQDNYPPQRSQPRQQLTDTRKRSSYRRRRNSENTFLSEHTRSESGHGIGFGIGHGLSRLWPPQGFSLSSVMKHDEAKKTIYQGASTFKGYHDPIPHMSPDNCRYFAVMESESRNRTDRATWHHDAFKQISYSLTGSPDSPFPWTSLEQPSMESCFGGRPGTTTLNYVIGASGCLESSLVFRSGVRPKKIKLMTILERLRQLEDGLEEAVRILFHFGCLSFAFLVQFHRRRIWSIWCFYIK